MGKFTEERSLGVGREREELLCDGRRISVWDDRKVPRPILVMVSWK